jgi:hypothetical protein
LNGIRTHDHSVRAGEDSSGLRPCDSVLEGLEHFHLKNTCLQSRDDSLKYAVHLMKLNPMMRKEVNASKKQIINMLVTFPSSG